MKNLREVVLLAVVLIISFSGSACDSVISDDKTDLTQSASAASAARTTTMLRTSEGKVPTGEMSASAPAATPRPSLASLQTSAAITSPSTTVSPEPVGTTNLIVYYLKENNGMYLVREMHKVRKTFGVARAALNELISVEPLSPGAFRILPENTQVLGISIEDGLATIDFSREVLNANAGSVGESLGIASIVNTLTEFPTISKVMFTVEGKVENAIDWWGHTGLYQQPFSRDLSRVYEPVIWVTVPVEGQVLAGVFTMRGSARIFEAMVSYRLTDINGNMLASGYTMASKGAPERGDFEEVISFAPSSAGAGILEVYETSMKDGSELHKVTIPVKW